MTDMESADEGIAAFAQVTDKTYDQVAQEMGFQRDANGAWLLGPNGAVDCEFCPWLFRQGIAPITITTRDHPSLADLGRAAIGPTQHETRDWIRGHRAVVLIRDEKSAAIRPDIVPADAFVWDGAQLFDRDGREVDIATLTICEVVMLLPMAGGH